MFRLKRAAAAGAAVILLAGGLTACGSSGETAGTEKTSGGESTQTTAKAAVTTAKAPETQAESADKVDIVDVTSGERPFALSVNNTPVAVKVQTGLNRAFLIYELPTEGRTSRLLALFKNVDDDLTVGTIRSARHYFLDYCFESDAIFVHYGWSHYAEDAVHETGIDDINGLTDSPFWRDNPENLGNDHTAYTSIAQDKACAAEKGFAPDADNASDTILLNYDPGDIDLSDRGDVMSADSVSVPYGADHGTVFTYDSEKGEYDRIVNGEPNTDYYTGEQFTAKNIIVEKVTHEMTDDNYYWNIGDIGSGEGYFITGGKAVPITWSKESQRAKTHYYYADGTQITVSDGRTYIEVQPDDMETTIS